MSLKQRLGLTQEPLWLMDGSAFIFRGFYAFQNMQRSDGFPTNALFIVTRMLLRFMGAESPRYFSFVLDGKGPTFRHELYPLYKAQRSATPEALVQQLEPIRRMVTTLGLPLEVSDGCEADDCIASLAARYSKERPVIIISGDKDLKQCLTPNVYLWDPGTKEEKLVTLDSFQEDTGLTPSQWPDVQALVGDSSDNIPGIPGIGPKTASKIFSEFSSLEDIRDRFDALTPKLQQKFEPHLDAMFLYRQLTRLDTERCTNLELEDVTIRPMDERHVTTLLQEFELRALARELAALARNGKLALAPSSSVGGTTPDGAIGRRAKASRSESAFGADAPLPWDTDDKVPSSAQRASTQESVSQTDVVNKNTLQATDFQQASLFGEAPQQAQAIRTCSTVKELPACEGCRVAVVPLMKAGVLYSFALGITASTPTARTFSEASVLSADTHSLEKGVTSPRDALAPHAKAFSSSETPSTMGTIAIELSLFDASPAKEKRVETASTPVPRTEDASALHDAEGEEVLFTGSVASLAAYCSQAETIIVPDLKSLYHTHSAWHDIPVFRYFDLGLASYLLDPEERDYGWPRLAAHWAEQLGKAFDNPGLLALEMGRALEAQLQATSLDTLMRQLEMPLIPVLAAMETTGIAIDLVAFKQFLAEVQSELDTITATIYTAAGGSFNIRSAQQLGEVLFSTLGLPTVGKTRGGQATTSQDALEKLSGRHPIVDSILEFRKLEKLRSTYLEPLPRLVDAKGRIHTSFNQLATATGRLSSRNPNLQNIPVRGDLGRRMRSCFKAEEGNLLISADYSQIELRVLAHMSQDPTLLAAFRDGADIHTRTASLLYDVALEDVLPDQRRNAKTINFGLIYGMGPQKLGQELHCSLAEAKKFIETYFSKLQHLKEFYDNVEASAREQGYVTTMAGRRRLLPEMHAEDARQRSQARRQAINTLIQGSAADIIKLAMLAAYEDATLREYGAQLVLQVHDELLLEVSADNTEAAGARLAEIMMSVRPGGVLLDVPLLVDWGAGNDWGAAH